MEGTTIYQGTPEGEALGFYCDMFDGWLLRYRDVIYILYIKSNEEGHGNTTRFLKNLLDRGFTVKISSVVNDRLGHICKNLGFTKVEDYHPYYHDIFDMWVKFREIPQK